jgi:hypothetical protein
MLGVIEVDYQDAISGDRQIELRVSKPVLQLANGARSVLATVFRCGLLGMVLTREDPIAKLGILLGRCKHGAHWAPPIVAMA